MSTQRRNLSRFISTFLWLCSTLAACGGGGPETALSTQALGGGFATGEVRPLVFDTSNRAEIQFSELSGSEKFSLIFFSANSDRSSFDVHLNGLSSSSARLLASPADFLAEQEAGDAPAHNLHGRLRQWEQELAAEDLDSALASVKQMAAPISCAGGRGLLFKVLSSLSNNVDHETVCGIEVKRSENAVYYVDETVLSSLNGGSLASILADFEAKIPHQRRLLGEESDVDQSGDFSVLFSPAVNRLGNSGGGFVTGYFYGGDLFPENHIATSNEREILFICVPDPNGQWNVALSHDFWRTNIASSVLPHEFQHMISFNQHVLIHNEGAEEAWANEGISHFIEDLSADGSLDRTGLENPSRVSLYLHSPSEAPFISGTSVAQRGGAYLFFRYLYEQADLGRYTQTRNGPELLSSLLQGPEKGIANIEAATGWGFADLLLDFYASLQLSQTGISSNPRYNFQGISLVGEQNDNRGTVLKGLQNQNLSKISFQGQISSSSGLFLEVNGNSLRDAGQGLSFSASPSMIAGGIVIRLQ